MPHVSYMVGLRQVYQCFANVPFSVHHALDCALGGFRIVQHNETRDVVVDCMKEAGYGDVVKEPKLQPLTGEKFKYLSANCESDPRSDIKCCGFWREQRQAFFGVKVVSPFTRSYSNQTTEQLFRSFEKQAMRVW